MNGGFDDSLEVITQPFAMTFGAALPNPFPSLPRLVIFFAYDLEKYIMYNIVLNVLER